MCGHVGEPSKSKRDKCLVCKDVFRRGKPWVRFRGIRIHVLCLGDFAEN